MNAYSSKSDLAFLAGGHLSRLDHHFDSDLPVPQDDKAGRGLAARIAALFRAIADYPRRLAVLDELNMMSDRELSDVGLHRTELGRVFDPEFAAARRSV